MCHLTPHVNFASIPVVTSFGAPSIASSFKGTGSKLGKERSSPMPTVPGRRYASGSRRSGAGASFLRWAGGSSSGFARIRGEVEQVLTGDSRLSVLLRSSPLEQQSPPDSPNPKATSYARPCPSSRRQHNNLESRRASTLAVNQDGMGES